MGTMKRKNVQFSPKDFEKVQAFLSSERVNQTSPLSKFVKSNQFKMILQTNNDTKDSKTKNKNKNKDQKIKQQRKQKKQKKKKSKLQKELKNKEHQKNQKVINDLKHNYTKNMNSKNKH